MSTPADRLTAIQSIYLDAIGNQTADLAKAQTNADVAAVQANVANAQLAYYTAEAAALTSNSSDVEDAFNAVGKALDEVKKARAAAAEIPTLLGALNTATGAATNLLSLAKASGA
jgi:lipopolysaccharide biosynthesis regulator YciM